MSGVRTPQQENWLAASAALAFDDSQTNRDREAFTSRRLGSCVCGKAATHLLADADGADWACRVPAAALAVGCRYDQCDDTCTVDCGHCKGRGRPVPADTTGERA